MPYQKVMTNSDIILNNTIHLFGAALLFLSPFYPIMIALLVLVVLDFIAGIFAAKHRKEAIRSNVMSRTVSKVLLYYLAIIAGVAIEVLIPGIPFVRMAAGFIGMAELKSIYENVGEVTGVDLWNYIRSMIDRRKPINNGSNGSESKKENKGRKDKSIN